MSQTISPGGASPAIQVFVACASERRSLALPRSQRSRCSRRFVPLHGSRLLPSPSVEPRTLLFPSIPHPIASEPYQAFWSDMKKPSHRPTAGCAPVVPTKGSFATRLVIDGRHVRTLNARMPNGRSIASAGAVRTDVTVGRSMCVVDDRSPRSPLLATENSRCA
jgi:hypothetical protein